MSQSDKVKDSMSALSSPTTAGGKRASTPRLTVAEPTKFTPYTVAEHRRQFSDSVSAIIVMARQHVIREAE